MTWPDGHGPPCPFDCEQRCDLEPSGRLFWRCGCTGARLDRAALAEAIALRCELDAADLRPFVEEADPEAERRVVRAAQRVLARGASGADVLELLDAAQGLTAWQRCETWFRRLAEDAAERVLARLKGAAA
jgi:hypothetical protein